MNSLKNFDFRVYFRRNKTEYLSVLIMLILGLILGIVVSFLSDNFLLLINSENNVLYNYINGDFSYKKEIFRLSSKFIIPIIIFIGLGLSYYTIILGYGFLIYNGVLFILNIIGLFCKFGLSCLFNVIILIIPINLIIFIVLGFVFVENKNRAKFAKQTGNFSEGYNQEYFLKMGGAILFSIILSCVYIFILGLFLRCNIFIISKNLHIFTKSYK